MYPDNGLTIFLNVLEIMFVFIVLELFKDESELEDKVDEILNEFDDKLFEVGEFDDPANDIPDSNNVNIITIINGIIKLRIMFHLYIYTSILKNIQTESFLNLYLLIKNDKRGKRRRVN
jgi:hypothetical protein